MPFYLLSIATSACFSPILFAVFQSAISIPHNANRIIDMKQSITLTGLGVEHFDKAVRGVGLIYQMFKGHLIRRGCQLHDWKPGHDVEDLMLTFTNRYLTPSKDAQGETPFDLGELVDPLNILWPLLRSEVHIQENVVEYWQRLENDTYVQVHSTIFV